MTQLKVEQCALTYQGAFEKPAFSLSDSPGRLCDLLLDALEAFGCTGDDLLREEGEPGEQGVTCEVGELETRVSLYGDRVEIHCEAFPTGNADTACTTADIAKMMDSLWFGLAALNTSIAARTHSFLFEADVRIRGASYREVLNRLAPAPESLPGGTETAIVYYLPAERGKGYGESSIVLNRLPGVERGLQVNATLV